MNPRIKVGLLALTYLLTGISYLSAQQKGQYLPGQSGLNAGVIPDPGFTYLNMAVNYSSGTLNDQNGNSVPGISGTYSFWVDENIFLYVPKFKFLGAHFAPFIAVNAANGSLVADLGIPPVYRAQGGGTGIADTWVQPLNLGWHLKRADVTAGYAFVAPTGRYTAGASNNVGSGYWGNNFTSAATAYLTKNKGTTANIFIDWEGHGSKKISTGGNVTPGQAFTMEWGIGQVLPLDKTFTKLFQVGLVGYDQWQVTSNSGLTSGFPYYSAQSLGFQTNFLMPAKGLNLFFKYYGEYAAKAHPIGRSIVFGGSWTLRIPKPAPPKQ